MDNLDVLKAVLKKKYCIILKVIDGMAILELPDEERICFMASPGDENIVPFLIIKAEVKCDITVKCTAE